ncbi:uroporphyrinogen decarboxylase family protein [Bacteroidota bacterium]
MNSRERLLRAVNHIEPDRIPYDLGSTQLTGISVTAYNNLRSYLNMKDETVELSDVIQQLAAPGEDLLDKLHVDTRGLFPYTSHNRYDQSQLIEKDEYWYYKDEWGLGFHFPKVNGHWYSLVESPLDNLDPTPETVDQYKWPEAADKTRITGLKQLATRYHEQGKAVVLKGLCAGVFEMCQRLRGMENALMDFMLFPDMNERLVGKIADLKIEFWEMVLSELADDVDVIVEADDYGTQESQLISPEQFRIIYKPHINRIIQTIRKLAPDAKVFFHSCGNVRPIIPDFIDMGIDILNPVHISAEGMDPFTLKKDFGNDITFWGGGVETQDVLPNGTAEQVAENVKRNIEALAPGGGFIFNTVHNIQSEVPPENVMSMWRTLDEFGIY